MRRLAEVQLLRGGQEWTIPVVPGRAFIPALLDELFPGDVVDFGDLEYEWLDVNLAKPRPVELNSAFVATIPRATETVRLGVKTECQACHRVAHHKLVVREDGGPARRCVIKGCNAEWNAR